MPVKGKGIKPDRGVRPTRTRQPGRWVIMSYQTPDADGYPMTVFRRVWQRVTKVDPHAAD
jgi:hypothetical protein